jgi:hypothetical protein
MFQSPTQDKHATRWQQARASVLFLRMAEDLVLFARETRLMMAARRSAFDDIAAAEMNEHGYS